ncbi:MAG: hypothetical protein LZF60_340050 [Nitrospira sp.]|nr:MAG: hypothetical protein LZF60_340050 [Nitrospira sp.]
MAAAALNPEYKSRRTDLINRVGAGGWVPGNNPACDSVSWDSLTFLAAYLPGEGGCCAWS